MKVEVGYPGGRTVIQIQVGALPRKGEEIRIPGYDLVVNKVIHQVVQGNVYEPFLDCDRVGP